ncbi:hypothetical protein WN51_11089 [Melipona quadrifasciata]|uniref:Uncharacterized protein n=1 Tax=Melipona quadrifasciata TaxID=166423 RepID=A0A0N0U6G5_9HYME|nr:hypothetical protein WN51_11089 [Melipona quadrifasciata]
MVMADHVDNTQHCSHTLTATQKKIAHHEFDNYTVKYNYLQRLQVAINCIRWRALKDGGRWLSTMEENEVEEKEEQKQQQQQQQQENKEEEEEDQEVEEKGQKFMQYVVLNIKRAGDSSFLLDGKNRDKNKVTKELRENSYYFPECGSKRIFPCIFKANQPSRSTFHLPPRSDDAFQKAEFSTPTHCRDLSSRASSLRFARSTQPSATPAGPNKRTRIHDPWNACVYMYVGRGYRVRV